MKQEFFIDNPESGEPSEYTAFSIIVGKGLALIALILFLLILYGTLFFTLVF